MKSTDDVMTITSYAAISFQDALQADRPRLKTTVVVVIPEALQRVVLPSALSALRTTCPTLNAITQLPPLQRQAWQT